MARIGGAGGAMRAIAIVFCFLLGGLALLGARCFNPTLPDCSYRCEANDRTCPPEYDCLDDGYCHLKSSTTACPYTMDLRPAADLHPLADMKSADGGADGGGDLANGD